MPGRWRVCDRRPARTVPVALCDGGRSDELGVVPVGVEVWDAVPVRCCRRDALLTWVLYAVGGVAG
jgi:hypothetical protein